MGFLRCSEPWSGCGWEVNFVVLGTWASALTLAFQYSEWRPFTIQASCPIQHGHISQKNGKIEIH